MENKEIRIFEKYESCIVEEAGKLRATYMRSFNLSPADAPDFYQRVLQEAPAVLIEFGKHECEDLDAIRAFLYSYFFNKLRDERKKAKRREKFIVNSADLEKPKNIPLCTMDVEESDADLSKFIVERTLASAPLDVRQLCLGFMKHNSWQAAGEALGWSKGKIYRTQQQVKAFFEENAKKCGELQILMPKKK